MLTQYTCILLQAAENAAKNSNSSSALWQTHSCTGKQFECHEPSMDRMYSDSCVPNHVQDHNPERSQHKRRQPKYGGFVNAVAARSESNPYGISLATYPSIRK